MPSSNQGPTGLPATEMPPKKYTHCKNCGYETAPIRWDPRPERQQWMHDSQCVACKNFKSKHGFTLTYADREQLKARPFCGYCGTSENLHIDHDHDTDKVRGYLCFTHNKALGMLGDNIAGLNRMISYLLTSTQPTNQ